MNNGVKQSCNLAILQFYNRRNRAIAALPMMLLIAGIVAEIAAAGVLSAYFLIQSGMGVKLSSEALVMANAGIEDALIKIIRDNNFTGSYSLTVGDKKIDVVIGPLINGKKIINSEGKSLLKRRKLEVIVNVNSLTGEVKTESIQEIAL